MKLISNTNNRYVFNLAKGEELFETLLSWCEDNDVQSATLTGLGAADELELAYYNLETKEYEKHKMDDEVEILSLTGNMGILDGKKILHIHGVFGKKDLSTFGGHLFSLKVSGACEIHLEKLKEDINRKFDEETGLNLMCNL